MSYDGNSLRVKKVAGSATTVYIFSGTKVIAEYQNGAAPSSPTTEYIYSGSQLLATVTSSTTTYHHTDHLSVRMTTDGTTGSPTYGQKIGEQGHYPFGESWYAANTTTKWQFTGYERDSESSNDYALARYHVNRLGRFSSPDPLGGDPANPQSLNRYAYVTNDPGNLTDPLGLSGGARQAPPNTGFDWQSYLFQLTVSVGSGVTGGQNGDFGFEPGGNLDLGQIQNPGGGVGGGDGGGGGSAGPAPHLAECTRLYFGVQTTGFTASQSEPNGGSNGVFNGIGSDTRGQPINIQVVNNVFYYNSAGLTREYLNDHPGYSGPPLNGLTYPNLPEMNYTARDLYNPVIVLETQIHELGHSLAAIMGLTLTEHGGEAVANSFKDCVLNGPKGTR